MKKNKKKSSNEHQFSRWRRSSFSATDQYYNDPTYKQLGAHGSIDVRLAS